MSFFPQVNRPLAVLAVTGMGALVYLGAATSTTHAQTEPAPDAAALQRKIEMLEKQVERLTKQVEALKRQPGVIMWVRPNLPVQPPAPAYEAIIRPLAEPLGTPFEFNGKTYYRSLLPQTVTAPQGQPTVMTIDPQGKVPILSAPKK